MIDAQIARLHSLAWRPGAWMTAAWWQRFGLEHWQDDYKRIPACRNPLDALIVDRRGFPAETLPATLSAQQKRLLSLEPRLSTLVVALGLVGLGCAEYLLVGRFRQQLSPVLGPLGCDQLLAIMPADQSAVPDIDSHELVAEARAYGYQWLDAQNDCTVWRAMSILQDPSPFGFRPVPAGAALPILLKLGRLL